MKLGSERSTGSPTPPSLIIDPIAGAFLSFFINLDNQTETSVVADGLTVVNLCAGIFSWPSAMV